MRAVAYLRVSTDDQADAGNGLNAQRDACAAAALREGRPLVGPFADEGVSGAAPLDKRPALMLALAEVGRGDVLLVAKRDRLGRDPFLVAMIEAAVKRVGGRVVSAAGEGTDGDGPTDILMRRIVDAFAEYERLVIKARTKAALGAKARRGERTGKVPLGFDLVDDGRRSRDGRPLALVENHAERATLDLIIALAASGLGPRAIARELTARAIPTKSGSTGWAHSTVVRILAPARPPFKPAMPSIPPRHRNRPTSTQHGVSTMSTRTAPRPTRRPSRATFSDELRDAIERSGMTAYAVGRESGVDPGILSRFLAGRRGVTSDTIDRLAAALGWPQQRRRADQGAGASGGAGRGPAGTTAGRAYRQRPGRR